MGRSRTAHPPEPAPGFSLWIKGVSAELLKMTGAVSPCPIPHNLTLTERLLSFLAFLASEQELSAY